MKIFSSNEIKKIEMATITREGISKLDLIERAAEAVAYEIESRFRPTTRFIFFCGPEDNGAQALAVARMLYKENYTNISVYLFNGGGSRLSIECIQNRDALNLVGDIHFEEIVRSFMPPEIGDNDVVIDGLFGHELEGPLSNGYDAVVKYINDNSQYTISIGCPSGLQPEWNYENSRTNIVNAKLTLANQFPLLSFYFAENANFIGEVKILELDYDKQAIRNAECSFNLVRQREVKTALKQRDKFANKYNFGHLMLVAGSYGMTGAAILAARASLRSGCGLVSVHSPQRCFTAIQSAVPEALFDPDKDDFTISDLSKVLSDNRINALAIGPGMRTVVQTIDTFEQFLSSNPKVPCLFDADAINCFTTRNELLDLIPQHSVITPHAGEFDRLFGKNYTDESRLSRALEEARARNIIIVIKGHFTMTVRPDGRVFINSSGNAGMATAGSGDVLTGTIGSFMAQGYSPEVASVIGAYVHGLAGDYAERIHGEYGLMASDIVDNLGKAIKDIISTQ